MVSACPSGTVISAELISFASIIRCKGTNHELRPGLKLALHVLEVDVVVQQEEPFLPGLPDDLVLDADVLGVAEVAPVRAHHLRMVDIEVVESVVFPERQIAREIQELDDGVVHLGGEQLEELRLRDAEARPPSWSCR